MIEDVKKILVAGLIDYHREADSHPGNHAETVADLMIRGIKLFEPKSEFIPTCGICGGAMSHNPHPNAGKPPDYVEIGTRGVCIPCTCKSRHKWAERATKAETELAKFIGAKPDESSRLLKNSEACDAINRGTDRFLKEYVDNSQFYPERERMRFDSMAEAQRDLTASIKDAYCTGLLNKKDDYHRLQLQRKDKECQARMVRIFKKIEEHKVIETRIENKIFVDGEPNAIIFTKVGFDYVKEQALKQEGIDV